MFPFLSYDYNNNNNLFIIFFFILPFFISLPHTFPARPIPAPATKLTVIDSQINATWHNFAKFLDAGKGTNLTGMSELKKYFHRFGYLGISKGNNFTDIFDERFETALLSYQKQLGLPVTGLLDSNTVTQIMSPRCGMSDNHNIYDDNSTSFHVTKHYAYFYGEPRWSKSTPLTLTYGFSKNHMIDYINYSEIKSVFQRAFARWSSVIPVSFKESKDYAMAEIKIGFYKGDHGDGQPFDGVLGVLAHAFSPENGRFHLDGEENWAVDFKSQKSKSAVDLESVVTHEIGHILGLAHSKVKGAIMYPSLSPRTKKVDLKIDDVEGIQALYGSNPNFKYSSLLESDISSSWGIGIEGRSSMKWVTNWVVFVVFFVCLSL